MKAKLTRDRWPTSQGEGSDPMFWLYWDTAWSMIISGIMFATIAHPDSEVRETWRS